MGRGLLESFPVFAGVMEACERALAPHVDWSLRAVLCQEEGAPSLERVDVVQPVLFAVMVGLAGLWRHHGIDPAVVIGHSQGEIAAAHVAGALDLDEAARIVAVRSRVLARLAGTGLMASVMAGRADVEPRLESWGGRVGVAAVNGPASTVVSGEAAAVEGLVEQLRADGMRVTLVPVDYASHSGQVEPLRGELEDLLAGPVSGRGEVAFCSTVTGGLLETTGLDAGYWYRNLRQPVQFQQGVEALLGQGHPLFVEVSPHPVLAAAVEETAEVGGQRAVSLPTLRRGHDTAEDFLTALGHAYVHGASPDWDSVFGGPHPLADLPTYAFQHQHFWPPAVGVPEDGSAAAATSPAPPEITPVEPAPAERLSALSPAERETELLDLVRAQVAAVLGYSDPQDIGTEQPLQDFGLDSMTAVQIRNRLNTSTGLRLAASTIFEHPTPADLARHLAAELAAGYEATGLIPVVADGTGPASGESLASLYVRACEDGQFEEIENLAAGIARFRPVFRDVRDLAAPPRGITLARGPRTPRLVCIPAFGWKPNWLQYTRLASGLSGRRDVSVLTLPGFVAGEPLPASAAALAAVLGEAVLASAGDEPFVLLGHSSGGVLAGAVAGHLAERGRPAVGLVLLDTLPWDIADRATQEWKSALFKRFIELDGRVPEAASPDEEWGDAWVTARAAYFALDLERADIPVPTLMVQATDRLPGQAEDWPVPPAADTVIRAPGDHFSMLEAENAAEVARIVDDWISAASRPQ